MEPASPRSRITSNRLVRIGAAGVVVFAVVAAWGVMKLRASDKRPAAPSEAGSETASEEIDTLRAAVARLERRSSALEASVAPPRPAAQPTETTRPAPPAGEQGPRADIDPHREALGKLDAALAADHGDVGRRRSAADAMRKELAAAMGGRGRIVAVECATAFCKAAFEEDTGAHQEIDTGALIDATPLLKHEAMFDYERVGALKRTIVYAALDGQSLSAARGIPAPELAASAPAR